MNIHFSKYHGCENDFVIIDTTEQALSISQEEVRWLCHRHQGIGADGVIILSHTNTEQPTMKIYNADGSTAQMCGNGLRCVVQFLVEKKLLVQKNKAHHFINAPIFVATDAGVKQCSYALSDNPQECIISVDMGSAQNPIREIILTHQNGRTFNGFYVSLGNPHVVIESQHPMQDAQLFGHFLSAHRVLQEGANISFVKYGINQSELVVYERGSGITQACGTGACATVLIGLHLEKIVSQSHQISLPGGTLKIEINEHSHVIMHGKSRFVFDGVIYWPVVF